jgi:hypothetical protein
MAAASSSSIAARFDIDTLVRCAAPRPLLLVAGEDDRYAMDAPDIADAARGAYAEAGDAAALRCEVLAGGHALTGERRDLVLDWLTTVARGS